MSFSCGLGSVAGPGCLQVGCPHQKNRWNSLASLQRRIRISRLAFSHIHHPQTELRIPLLPLWSEVKNHEVEERAMATTRLPVGSYCTRLPIASVSSSVRLDTLPILHAGGAFYERSLGRTHIFKQTYARNVTETRQPTAICGIQASTSSDVPVAKDKLNTLKDINVYDANGATIPLVGLWERRTAVVAFARHFGCILCRKRADLLQSRKAEMDAAGVALVLIAPGNPEQARQFIEQTRFAGEVYADPAHATYNALEFVNGASSVLNLKSGTSLAKAFMEGYRQDWKLSFYKDTVQRGGWQQGGILVVGPGTDAVRYLFKDAKAGDEPNLQDVIDACCSS